MRYKVKAAAHVAAEHENKTLGFFSFSKMLTFSSLTVAAIAIVTSFSLPTTAARFEASCNSLISTLSIPHGTIYLISHISAGTNLTFPNLPSSCGVNYQFVTTPICRVALNYSTSPQSSTTIEAWLPLNWTGRFLSTGNGGINGCPSYADMAYATSLGFATTGSNNGHDGMTGVPFLNNPDVVTDFAWRALHTSAVVGKQLTSTFYGRPHSKAYYLGCSTGGRQGFKAAQSFPTDFDGIVAGAPAISFNNLTSWSGTFYPIIRDAGPDGYPPPATWPAIDAAILSQCDAIDGLADGIIENPLLCSFRPESLICPPSTPPNKPTCITAHQAATIRAIFSPFYGIDGAFIHPGYQIAPTIVASVYASNSKSQFLYTNDWFKYAVYNDASFDADTITPDMAAYAWHTNPGDINTWSGDLAAFRDAGGKILHYHGLQDQVITSAIGPLYYDHVARTMGLPSSSLDHFYRFFRISGLAHCVGGAGAGNVGNRGSSAWTLEPEGNVLMAMVRWVEEGVAPEYVEGAKFVNKTKETGVEYTRRHCRYPTRNVYRDGAWACVE